MKIFTCLLTFIITSAFSSSSTSLNCDYHFGGLHLIGNVYRCIVKDNLNIFTEESAQITSVDGVHKDNRSTDDVAGFFASSKIIWYFPKNFDKIFPNLLSIYLTTCGLLEIHQEDLKVFPKLISIELHYNNIQVLEQGLFDFNPKLKKIILYERNLIHIDPNVFDNLPKLGYFTLSDIICEKVYISNSREKVRAALTLVKFKCVNSDFVTLEKDIRHLDNQSKVLDYDDFNEKFIDFEMKYKNSKFLKFRPIRDIYVNLKYINENEPTTPDNKVIEKVTDKININVETVTKPEYPTNQFLSDLQNISSNIDDLKNSQCGLKDILTDVKSSQDSLSTLFSELSVSQDEVGSSLEDIKSSVSNIESKVVSFDNLFKISQDNLTGIDTKIVDLQKQNNGLKTELMDLNTKFQENLESLKDNFADSEAKNAENFDRIEHELASSRHKIEISLEEKISKIEKRLLKKFEDIFEEKLGKILDEKLIKFLESKQN